MKYPALLPFLNTAGSDVAESDRPEPVTGAGYFFHVFPLQFYAIRI